jgi:hypothetical protein
MPQTPTVAGDADRPGLHRWILGAVLLHELVLFTAFGVAFWLRRSPDRPRSLTGEGMVVQSDGCGYYAWLRSPLIDGDWDFDNEFDEHNAPAGGLPFNPERTPLGRRSNPFSVGPACLWAPAVIVVHVLHSYLPAPLGGGTGNGYSLLYQLAVGGTALLVAAAALAGLYGICRVFARPTRAALAAALLVLGTTLLNYGAIEVTMGHGSGAAATVLLVWYWLTRYGSPRTARWLAVGALVGLAALMRWQLALLALLPAGEFVLEAWRDRREQSARTLLAGAGRLALAGCAAVVVFLPQMIAWKVVYGQWLVSPVQLAHSWLHPDFERVLLSTDRGLFYWTPLTLVALFGCLLALILGVGLRNRADRAQLLLLLATFATQVYFLASVSGPGVFLGSAFGQRQLTEGVVLLAPGLALLFEAVPRRPAQGLFAVCLALAVWNVLLMAEYHFEILPRQAGADLATLLANLGRLLRQRHVHCLVFLAGPALLAAALLWRRSLTGRISLQFATLTSGKPRQ